MLEVVDQYQYKNVISNSRIIYNAPEFHEVNKEKAEKIYYFLYRLKKYKSGLIAGVKDGQLMVPYSAPFGIFENLESFLRLEDYSDFLEDLEKFSKEKGLKKIYYKLPPVIYNQSEISKLSGLLLHKGYELVYIDLNYYFDLTKDLCEYEKCITRAARKNLHIAIREGVSVSLCETNEEKTQAYNLIALNRSQNSYPLKMTLEHVEETVKVVPADFFLVKQKKESIGAAIVFHVNSQIAQVIYWGHNLEYGNLKPVNYLAYYLIKYYTERKKEILDIGPSTEEGTPNFGLCEFKEGIGCSVCSKFTFIKSL